MGEVPERGTEGNFTKAHRMSLNLASPLGCCLGAMSPGVRCLSAQEAQLRGVPEAARVGHRQSPSKGRSPGSSGTRASDNSPVRKHEPQPRGLKAKSQSKEEKRAKTSIQQTLLQSTGGPGPVAGPCLQLLHQHVKQREELRTQRDNRR